ncbi:hypothetical protein [Microvirga lotononidis]|uniref:hypothetical protein n=1 Tax=Microvirga lotononidis TaxID=864069 RepID=UPI000300BC61|nr:hypothetical protein [Microvirga lotononidis]WQO27856.1 hypothetical protein U0023_01720 [Microvirga lotononidis]
MASENVSASAETELKLLSAVAVRIAILELLPAFERESVRKVAVSFALNPAVKIQIEAASRSTSWLSTRIWPKT